ncbi:DUF6470 family protein [Paenibacillus sp. UMB4589-SE434]|uniref:DUF6470 family protein n=1 Tax=Paenibacillus sp. UMB4589-SE434 TaxID=3046314 RepID=UPI00254B67EB|nr:DUF6470 family protein [Paenibacillus sp. UMB4589-SE434]MDK8181631.1 DUF6470 family protein [Paenibacillus sp. UMB4589-SE434]
MNIPHIQINQQFAKIGLDTTPGRLNMETPLPKIEVSQEHVSVKMNHSEGRLEIDSRKAWSALGKGRFEEITDRIAQDSLQISMRNISNIASEGDRMMAFHNKQNAFAEIAREKMFREYPIEFAGPSSYDNVEVNYIPGILTTEWNTGRVDINFERTKPQVDYYPGKVNPYLVQKNFIFFSSNGQQLDAVV